MDNTNIKDKILNAVLTVERNRISLVENCSVSIIDRQYGDIFIKPWGASFSEILRCNAKRDSEYFPDKIHLKIYADIPEACAVISYYPYCDESQHMENGLFENILTDIKNSGIYFNENTAVYSVGSSVDEALDKIFAEIGKRSFLSRKNDVEEENFFVNLYDKILAKHKKRIYGTSEYSAQKANIKNKS